jgi:hypothetical protein
MPHERHVKLMADAQPELRLPPPVEAQLEFTGAVRGRAGSSSVPSVQAFFDALQPPLREPALPKIGASSQRLRNAPPIDERPPMGVVDVGFVRRQVETSRTALDMVGVPIGRDALRKTPKARMPIVVHQKYRDRGKAALMRTGELMRQDEQALLAARRARAERTRLRLRAVQEANRRFTAHLPVQVAAARAPQAELLAYQSAAAERTRQFGAEEVTTLIETFEGHHTKAVIDDDDESDATAERWHTRKGDRGVEHAQAAPQLEELGFSFSVNADAPQRLELEVQPLKRPVPPQLQLQGQGMGQGGVRSMVMPMAPVAEVEEQASAGGGTAGGESHADGLLPPLVG